MQQLLARCSGSIVTANYLDMSNPSHLMMVADDVVAWQHPNHNSLVVVLFVCVVVAQSPVKEELQLDNPFARKAVA